MAQSKSFFCVGVHFLQAHTKTKATLAGSLAAGEVIDPADAARSFAVDLANTPLQTAWATIEVDDLGVDQFGNTIPMSSNYDPAAGVIHVTSVGPQWPLGSRRPGAVYLESKTFDAVRKTFDPQLKAWPPTLPGLTQPLPYQFESVAWSDQRRYHGFHAALLAQSGTLLQLDVFAYGAENKPKRIWIDGASTDDCDPTRTAFPNGAKPDGSSVGAVFLRLKLCAQIGLRGPKQPPGAGA